MKGPGSKRPIRINGLLDTGADTSVLPLDYLRLLGYESDEVKPTVIGQVDGSANAWEALRPCVATLPGGPSSSVELWPLFVDGSLNVLWGRADFMSVYSVEVNEAAKNFTLRRW